MKTRRRIISGGLSAMAPLLSLALLLVLAVILPNRTVLSDESDQRKAEIAVALAEVPYIIGSWAGEDEQVSPEAQKLLRLNASLSRTYQKPGHPGVHVLFVHCSDARDMIGHYPPICYPSSGWIRTDLEGEPEQIEIPCDDRLLPVRLYGFRRMRDRGVEDRIRIFNGFVLPDGTVTRNIDDINEQSERLAVSVQGVAQFQIITSPSVGYDQAVEEAGELLAGMKGMLKTLNVPGGGGT